MLGPVFTVSVAILLLGKWIRYLRWLWLASYTSKMVAPAISDPFFRHWYLRGELLAADTVNAAVGPAQPATSASEADTIMMTGTARVQTGPRAWLKRIRLLAGLRIS